jgi:CBS domain-containing protein
MVQVTEWKDNILLDTQPGEKGILMCSIFFDYDFVYGDKVLMQLRRLF